MFLWLIICLILSGYLIDRTDYIKTIKWSCIITIIVVVPIFVMIYYTNKLYTFALLQFIFCFGLSLNGASQSTYYVHSINDGLLRYTVIGIAYNICQALFAGTAPLIAQILSHYINIISVSIYILIINVIALIIMYIIPKKVSVE